MSIDDKFYWETKKKQSKREKYQGFFEEARQLNVSDFSVSADRKAEILAKYFPGRFGDNGKQPLSRYDSTQIGSLFNTMFNYAKKTVETGKKAEI